VIEQANQLDRSSFSMSENQPDNTDAILGGQTPPPVDAAVLGGVAGIEQQLINQWSLSKESISQFSFETVFVNDNAEIIERKQKESFCYTVDLNGIPLEMVYVPAGSFMMGGFDEAQISHKLPEPLHLVTLQSLFMGKYPVTQKQYLALMGTNPARFQADDRHPVEEVSWRDAMEFCRRLSELTNKNFTLPSESQWEYACRAGTDTNFYFGQEINTDLANFADFKPFEDSRETIAEYYKTRKTTPVGIYPPNSWGLYDTHGNVYEWCLDIHHCNYIGAPSDGSAWIDFDEDNHNRMGNSHPCRGGSWRNLWDFSTSYKRGYSSGDSRIDQIGFRVCMVLNSDDRYGILPYREINKNDEDYEEYEEE
jgi:eukaryotic-like serine/threonine-protein kinase